MDSTQPEQLLFLAENIHDIRKLGKEWGFSEETIDRCSDKALGTKLYNTTLKEQCLKVKTKIQRYVGLKIVIALSLFLCCYGAYTAMIYAPADSFLGRCYIEAEQIVQRNFRKMMAPLHKFVRLEHYYYSDCIVDNPFFVTPPVDCYSCENYKSVKELKMDVKTLKPHLLNYPLVHRGMQKPVSLLDVRTLIEEHKSSLKDRLLLSNAKWANFVSDLAREDLLDQIIAEDKFTSEWATEQNMFGAQLMRRLFPRPAKVPTEAELSLDKRLFIDGKNAKERILPNSRGGTYSWYAQGSGSRVIKFVTPEGCEDVCKELKVRLNEGDILTFTSNVWDVTQEDNGDAISVSYLGYITL